MGARTHCRPPAPRRCWDERQVGDTGTLQRSRALSKRRVQAGGGGHERQLSIRRVNRQNSGSFISGRTRLLLRSFLTCRYVTRSVIWAYELNEGILESVFPFTRRGPTRTPSLKPRRKHRQSGQHSYQRNVHFNFDVYDWDDDAYLTGHDVVACYLVEIGVTPHLPTICNQTAHF